MRDVLLHDLITRYRNNGDTEQYKKFKMSSVVDIIGPAKEVMDYVPATFGDCAMLTAVWVKLLREKCGIPAVAVAGDLKLADRYVFKATENISVGDFTEGTKTKVWSGHCWLEVDGHIGDISLYRTAGLLDRTSPLKQFVEGNFNQNHGCVFLPVEDIPSQMKYNPKYILTDHQLEALMVGLGHRLQPEEW